MLHPSEPDELELKENRGGSLSGAETCPVAESVAGHLLGRGMGRTGMPFLVSPLLFGERPKPVTDLSPELDAAYESVLDRVFSTVLERRRLQRERCGVKRALALYALEGISGLSDNPELMRGLTAYRSLLEICQELRYEDPKRMVDAGSLAVYVAGRLNARRYGARRVADYKCRALIELSNAYRVADRLDEAETTLAEATAAFAAGTGDDLLKARLYDVRASLFGDRRSFAAAGEALDAVHAIYARRGDRHLAGRTLISKGIYAGYGGAAEEAVRLLREGLALIDAERDPALVYGAVHNQAHFLLTCGRLHEARALLRQYPATPEVVGGRVNLLKIRWLAAQIDAGLGDFDRAAQELQTVKERFEEDGLYYKAALVSLEMATVGMCQGRQDEARALVVEALGVFKSLRIEREALGSLLLLDRAFEAQAATRAMVEGVIALLKRAEDDPARAPTPL